MPGVRFVNLQYDDCAADLAAARARFGVEIHAAELDLMNDLDAAAAFTCALDLVISPATSVAVMAGALGVPVWEFAITTGYWHTHGTAGVPWYPSLRLFCRDWQGDWAPVMSAVAAALRDFARSAAPAATAEP